MRRGGNPAELRRHLAGACQRAARIPAGCKWAQCGQRRGDDDGDYDDGSDNDNNDKNLSYNSPIINHTRRLATSCRLARLRATWDAAGRPADNWPPGDKFRKWPLAPLGWPAEGAWRRRGVRKRSRAGWTGLAAGPEIGPEEWSG